MNPRQASRDARSSHVLILVENLPVPFDRRVWSEARALRESGYEVTVVSPVGPNDLPRHEVLEGVTVLRHPLREAGSGAIGYVREYLQALWWQTRLAWRVWRSGRFDVIHLCNPPDLLFLVALPFKLLGAKVVFDHHDLGPELWIAKYGTRGPLYAGLRLAERATFWSADHVLSTNESYAEVARTRGGKASGEVTVVRSGPSQNAFPCARRGGGDGRSVGYVGVMAEQDGVDHLLLAMRELVHERGLRDLRLTLIGDGPSRVALEQLACELALTDHVDFRGFLTGADLVREMSRFDIGVCPDPVNGYNEHCTMNKVLEYMALGIPIVQYDLDEGRVSAGDASLYAGADNDPTRLADQIERLAGDGELRRRMGEIGRARWRDGLAWEHQVPKLLSAYEVVSSR